MTSDNATIEAQLDPSGYVEHQVQHYKQRFNWDCGVSCVLMLLAREQREEMLDRFDEICQEEGFGHSTWTIDLCYLLKRFGIKHCMYTTMLGVNEDYRRHGYYDRIMDMDRSRVQRRFSEAGVSGVRVVEARVGLAALLDHLTAHGPAIVLVDAGLLVCDLCKHNKLKVEFRRCFGGGYSGHYIVVVGYNWRRGRLLYRDPAVRARLCAARVTDIQRARLAPGTDEDLLLVYKNFR